MKVILGAVFCLSLMSPLPAKTKPASSPVDPDYVSALATANRFLQAWQTQDQETAILMLTDHLKQHTSEDRLESFLFPGAPTQSAYEIGHGKKLGTGRYSFPVAVFAVSADAHKRTHPRSAQIIVTRTGKNDWTIDKLP